MKDKYTINNLTFKFNRMKKHLFAALIAACAVATTACDDTEETKYFYGFGTVALRNEQVVIKQYDYTYYTTSTIPTATASTSSAGRRPNTARRNTRSA